ncbi:hypothetical protein DL98DRAFT_627256 [Cadophora sp. DSE1049]|nr:hypothetical protein DL98DRAFT_627256 [Cadophora sp. DSE1049]
MALPEDWPLIVMFLVMAIGLTVLITLIWFGRCTCIRAEVDKLMKGLPKDCHASSELGAILGTISTRYHRRASRGILQSNLNCKRHGKIGKKCCVFKMSFQYDYLALAHSNGSSDQWENPWAGEAPQAADQRPTSAEPPLSDLRTMRRLPVFRRPDNAETARSDLERGGDAEVGQGPQMVPSRLSVTSTWLVMIASIFTMRNQGMTMYYLVMDHKR